MRAELGVIAIKRDPELFNEKNGSIPLESNLPAWVGIDSQVRGGGRGSYKEEDRCNAGRHC